MVTFASLFLGLVLGTHPVEFLVGRPIASLEIYLDGRTVAVLQGEPWSLDCDFGEALQPHHVVAVARDELGAEVDRAEQWVNLPRAQVEATLALEGIEAERASHVRVVWSSVENVRPESLEVTFDGRSLAPEGDDRFRLPAYDPRQPHLLGARLRFPGGLGTRVEVALGGRWGSELAVEMTAVPFISAGRVELRPESLTNRVLVNGRPQPVVAVDRGAADIVAVLESSSLLALGGHGRMLDLQGGISGQAFELRSGDEIRFLSPTPRRERDREVPFDLFPVSRPFSPEHGSLPYLFSHARMDQDRRQQLADAVAVAGIQAAAGNRRRAVVLVLGGRWQDESQYEIARVREFLATLRVPLLVWSASLVPSRTVGEDRLPLTIQTAWGRARDISSITRFLQAFVELRGVLDSQAIVWVEGSHLPQSITVADREVGGEPVPVPQELQRASPSQTEQPVVREPEPRTPAGGTSSRPDSTPALVVAAPADPLTLASRLNRARGELGRPPLRWSAQLSDAAQVQANVLSAAIDFEAALQDAEIAAEDLRLAGYRAKRWVQAVVVSSQDADGMIARWAELQPTAFEEFLDAELEDVGIGIGWAAGAPLYGLVAALSWDSYFEVVLQGLEDIAVARRRVVEEVNRERQLAGLPPLRLQYQLNHAAQNYAERMRDQGFYGHTAPDGATVLERVKAAGYRLERAGENLANGPETPEQVVTGWMASPDHRANILDRRFTEMGVGIAVRQAGPGDYEILWVQCFGQPRR